MELMQQHANLCSGLGDFHRLMILYALAERTHNVSELVARIGLSQPAVSRHLKILRDCGAVSARREGKAVYYEVSDARILTALDILRAVLLDQIKQQSHAAERPVVNKEIANA